MNGIKLILTIGLLLQQLLWQQVLHADPINPSAKIDCRQLLMKPSHTIVKNYKSIASRTFKSIEGGSGKFIHADLTTINGRNYLMLHEYDSVGRKLSNPRKIELGRFDSFEGGFDRFHSEFYIAESNVHTGGRAGQSEYTRFINIIDTKSGKYSKIKVPQGVQDNFYTDKLSDGQRYLFFQLENGIHVYDISTGTEAKSYLTESLSHHFTLIPDTDLAYAVSEQNELIYFNLVTKKFKKIPVIPLSKGRIQDVIAATQDKLIISMSVFENGGNTKFAIYEFNMATRKLTESDFLKEFLFLSRISDIKNTPSEYLLFLAQNPDKDYYILKSDLSVFKKISGQGFTLKSEHTLKNGKHVFVFSHGGVQFKTVILDYKSRTLHSPPIDAALFDILDTQQTKDSPLIFALSKTAGEGGTENRTLIKYNLATKKTDRYTLPASYTHVYAADENHIICLTQSLEIRSVELKTLKTMTRARPAVKKKFYKNEFTPGLFAALDPATHMEDVVDFIITRKFTAHPEWALPSLVFIMKQSDVLFETLKKDLDPLWPELAGVIAKQQYPVEFLNSAIKPLQEHMEVLSKIHFDNSTNPDVKIYEVLGAFKSVFPLMDPVYLKQKTFQFSEAIVPYAGNVESSFYNLSPRRTQKYIQQYFRKLMGLPHRELMEVALIRDAALVVKPIILSTEKFKSANANHALGFYFDPQQPIQLERSYKPGETAFKKEYTLSVGSKQYKARITARAIDRPIEEFSPKITAPDYKSIWKDDDFNLSVVVGSNMEKEDSKYLIEEYREYFKNRGFSFDKGTPVNDIEHFIKDGVENGSLDLILKEAHSDGSESLLMNYKSGTILTGVKKLGKGKNSGKTKRVHLILNDTDSGFSTVSADDFGQWLRTREEKKHGQFIYINTTCSAESCMAQQIEKAHTPVLLNIGGDTSMETFTNTPESGTRALLDGLLAEKDFSEMRTLIQKTKNYKAGEDQFLFPDDEEFQTLIREQIKVPLDIKKVIRGPDGKRYDFDNAPLID